jgi:hypothetical protein
MSESKLIHVRIDYRVGSKTIAESLQVPVSGDDGWKSAVHEKVHEVMRPRLHGGIVGFRYRLDGSAKPLSWWERCRDSWFVFCQQGTRVTVRGSVALWPRADSRLHHC